MPSRASPPSGSRRADKLTWTYTIRSRLQVVGRPAGHRRRRGLDLQQDDDRRGRGHRERQLRRELQEGHRPSPTKLVIELKKPQATMAALDVPIVPEAHLGEGQGLLEVQQRQDLPDRRQRAVHPDRLQGRPVREAEAQQDFWRGAPKFDELVFKYYKDQDAAVAALQKGEVSFVAGPPDARSGRVAQERAEHQGQRRPRPPLLRARHQPGRAGQGRQEVRQRQQGAARPEGAPGAVHGDRPQDHHRQGLPGPRRRGRGLHPAALRRLLLEAVRQPEALVRPRPRRPSCSTRPATRRTARASASARTASRSTSASCATPPTRTTRRSASTSRSGGASSASA